MRREKLPPLSDGVPTRSTWNSVQQAFGNQWRKRLPERVEGFVDLLRQRVTRHALPVSQCDKRRALAGCEPKVAGELFDPCLRGQRHGFVQGVLEKRAR